MRIRERSRGLLGGYERSQTDVETENINFSKKFQILTGDPHTAFYILTPHFMEYILSLDQRANGQTYMSFVGERVYIAVNTGRDSFKASRGAMNASALQERIKSEVRYITDIID
ncbi:MAG: DUF3137 domain-containing protein [Clostridiales bacterium]|nr:DUF3137 domain-containing protein [Clostridiales bacterium]